MKIMMLRSSLSQEMQDTITKKDLRMSIKEVKITLEMLSTCIEKPLSRKKSTLHQDFIWESCIIRIYNLMMPFFAFLKYLIRKIKT